MDAIFLGGPRFKNISSHPLHLLNPDGSVYEIIPPGATVVGEQYRAFAELPTTWGYNQLGFLKEIDVRQ